jgi:DNA invertase Pin-like site-specific DNA recombinase
MIESPVSSPPRLRTEFSDPMVSHKIKPHHRERLAVVYVRQSSVQQVLNNQESTALQYGLREKAIAWDWPRERIIVIDEDQAHSGSTAVGRTGFQRLLVEIGLNHVGLILGIEMSRLARSCKDWYQLLEVCAIFQTVLADQEGLYDPRQYNDRLLLGLKGTISEAELHLIHQRMFQGQLNKAKRGELFNHPPIGYVRPANGLLAKDPDQEVQAVVDMIFDQFDQLGSINAVVRYLLKHNIRLPIRATCGDDAGQLQWRPPNRQTLRSLLRHPIYAGVYTWGRHTMDPRRKIPGRPRTGRVEVAPEQCMVFLKDHCPAYITWDRYQAIRRQLTDNQWRRHCRGALREGSALLGGLLVCGQCDRQMQVKYNRYKRRDGCDTCQVHYQCGRQIVADGAQWCQKLSGRILETLITQQVLAVLQPASMALTLQAAKDIERERKTLGRQWQYRLERARYQVDRAARQYHAVEPENRLVARELERQWEENLLALQQEKEAYTHFCEERSPSLTPDDRRRLKRLSTDINRLWHASTTSYADRKTIIRHLIEKVTITTPSESSHMDVTIRWAGGFTSEHTWTRPIHRYEQLDNYPALLSRIVALHNQNKTSVQIANQLNQEGYHPPQCDAFTGSQVRKLLAHQVGPPKRSDALESTPRTKDEWWISDLSHLLNIPGPTLYNWLRRGWAQGRRRPGVQQPWLIWADAEEQERLQRLHTYPRSYGNQPPNTDLIRPKPRPET